MGVSRVRTSRKFTPVCIIACRDTSKKESNVDHKYHSFRTCIYPDHRPMSGTEGGKIRAANQHSLFVARLLRASFVVNSAGADDLPRLFNKLTLVPHAHSRACCFSTFVPGRFFLSFALQGSQRFDTSRKMRPPAWTDRILFSPSGPHAVSPLKYTSVPDSCHSDHRPVYAKFRVQLAD